MNFDWWSFALQTINFAILVWLLHRFLYRPVLRLIEARRSEIDKQFINVKAAQDEVKSQAAEIKAERAKIGAEREQAIKTATQQAEGLARARKAQAEKEAAALMDGARKTLANEREQALTEARRSALDLAAQMTRRLIESMPIEKRADAWLDLIEKYFDHLPEHERSMLIAQLAGEAAVTVLTATPLPEASKQAWREGLRKILGDEAAIDFAMDLQLIAGVELHFPQAILRFSLQGTLSSLRSELEGHDNSCR